MARSLIVPQVDEQIVHRLRRRAACSGRSAEEAPRDTEMLHLLLPAAFWDEVQAEGLIEAAAPAPTA